MGYLIPWSLNGLIVDMGTGDFLTTLPAALPEITCSKSFTAMGPHNHQIYILELNDCLIREWEKYPRLQAKAVAGP